MGAVDTRPAGCDCKEWALCPALPCWVCYVFLFWLMVWVPGGSGRRTASFPTHNPSTICQIQPSGTQTAARPRADYRDTGTPLLLIAHLLIA